MLNSYRVDVWSGTGIWVERVTMRLVTEGEAKRVLRAIARLAEALNRMAGVIEEATAVLTARLTTEHPDVVDAEKQEGVKRVTKRA